MRARPLEPQPPGWLLELLRREHDASRAAPDECRGLTQIWRRDGVLRVSTRISSAVLLDADELSRAVTDRYAEIAAILAREEKKPLRMWNYLPGIVETLAPGLDRYMAFNRGRFCAYAASAGGAAGWMPFVPAASAIGTAGQDLVIECLASTAGGRPVENPRQVASWRYSRRYGPRPPCFARGTLTVLDGRRVLLLAGTASIVGEESQHAGNVRAQVLETIRNMEAVLIEAGATASEPLQHLTDLQSYVVHDADVDLVDAELRAHCADSIRLEAALARLCRPELLVEIEGLATLP